MLATDVVLGAIIGRSDHPVRKLIEQAQNGQITLVIPQPVLYWAIHSVKPTDSINTNQLAELIKYSQILPDAPEYLGPNERHSWLPSSEAVAKWRRLVLEED